MSNIFVGVPIYDQLVPQTLPELILATERHGYTLQTECGSLLALMFNKLWCSALNQRREKGLTHFAMHHADIEAPPGWLDVLVEEHERVGADVLSVVVPIKDQRGLTSTGWQDPETRMIRRFTMNEIARFPDTFNAVAAAEGVRHLFRPQQECQLSTPKKVPDPLWLVVNTGLWLCDFTRPWVEEVCFSVLDAVVRDEESGRFTPKCLPEDWNFSGWCARQGLRVFATTKVKIAHHGKASYRNDTVWGEWQTDRGDNAA